MLAVKKIKVRIFICLIGVFLCGCRSIRNDFIDVQMIENISEESDTEEQESEIEVSSEQVIDFTVVIDELKRMKELASLEEVENQEGSSEIRLINISHSYSEGKEKTHINFNVGTIMLNENGEIIGSIKYPVFDDLESMKRDGAILQAFYQSEGFKQEGFTDKDIEKYFDWKYRRLGEDERNKIIESVLSDNKILIEKRQKVQSPENFSETELQEMMEIIDEWSMERILDSDYWFNGKNGEWILYRAD